MGKPSRDKGGRGERWFVQRLQEAGKADITSKTYHMPLIGNHASLSNPTGESL